MVTNIYVGSFWPTFVYYIQKKTPEISKDKEALVIKARLGAQSTRGEGVHVNAGRYRAGMRSWERQHHLFKDEAPF